MVKVFEPLSSQPPSFVTAVVRVPPASDPASGSVSDQQPSFFPVSYTHLAAGNHDARFTRESSMAKLYAGEVAVRVANEAVQIRCV